MALKLLRMEVLHPTYNYAGGKNNLTAFTIRLNYGIETADLDKFSKDITGLTNQGQALAADDKVFFTPWSEVPRYKFNEYARDKPKLARVITLNKATAIVVDPEKIVPTITGSTYKYKYNRIPKSMLQLNMALVNGLKYDEMADYIYLRDGYLSDFQALVPFNNSLVETVYIQEYGPYIDTTAVGEKVDIANDLLTTSKKLLSDSVLLEEINQGVHITSEVYDQLCNMLRTTDQQNVGLAMELMANANYKDSEFKIALLLNKFANKLMNHKNASLVNFRSLLSYFNKYEWRSGEVEFATSVVKNANTNMTDYQERVDLVRKSMLDYVNRVLDGGIFSVNEIVINHSPNLSNSAEVVEEEVGELEED